MRNNLWNKVSKNTLDRILYQIGGLLDNLICTDILSPIQSKLGNQVVNQVMEQLENGNET